MAASMQKNVEFDAKTEALSVAAYFAPQIKDRIVVVTGVNLLGLGFSTAEAFAAQSPRVLVLTGRTESKKLDLSSLAGTRTAATSLMENPDVPHIDLLVNNAGFSSSIKQAKFSSDGFETHFAVNHLALFLFTNLILLKMILVSGKSRPGAARIINLSSEGHMYSGVRFSDLNFNLPPPALPESERPDIEMIRSLFPSAYTNPQETYHPLPAYGQSKTANVLFAIGLNQRLYQKYHILSLAVHPGAIGTELNRDFDEAMLKGLFEKWNELGLGEPKSLGQGSATTLRCAVDPDIRAPVKEQVTGKYRGVYWSDCQVAGATDWAIDGELAEKLWAKSEELCGQKFDP